VVDYDVVVVGGGVAGSVAARFLGEYGLKTLLIEKYKTPRCKSCSGIQFPYFERLIGEKIPQDKLCSNRLFRVDLSFPSGKRFGAKMGMSNFWRSTFDSWLNGLAQRAGADFADETELVDFASRDNGVWLKLKYKNRFRSVMGKYLVCADGMGSKCRRKLRPGDFRSKVEAGAINYYFKGEGDLDANTLYQVYNLDFNPLMFAWTYLKDDLWVIGTGANSGLKGYAQRFFNYMGDKYHLRGEIVKTEGFSNPLKEGVFLGEGNILFAGDAAGLMDLYRGVAMDNAALSGRFAAKAVKEAFERGGDALEYYKNKMSKMVDTVNKNANRNFSIYSSNEEFEKELGKNFRKMGVKMLLYNQLNKILPSEKIKFLPP
jgi:flavin-dependent dehydrogenase